MQYLTEEIIRTFMENGAALGRRNLIAGSAGNMSIRFPNSDVIAITTRGSDLTMLKGSDVVAVDAGEASVEGTGRPSSELLMHRTIYAGRPDVSAIIHTHSIFATVMASLQENIPAFIDEMTFVLGGEIETAAYARPGSEELGRNAVKALGDRAAVLLANHGAIGVGSTLSEALEACDLVERAAQMYVFARALGSPKLIPSDVMMRQYSAYRKKHALE
jgi:L-fuculose-phosphate aldolase